MPDNSISLNNKIISFEEIKAGVVVGETPFEQSTLTFCRQWLNGQATFSLKTSGSTGKPKTIEISREQMLLSARQTINFFNLKPADTVLVCLNTAYIAGIMMLVRAFESGAKIIVVEPSSNPLINISTKIDFLAIVPLQLQQILDNPISRSRMEDCRATIVGGAQVSYALEEKLGATKANVYATFGMTETLTHFALKKLNSGKGDYFTVFDDVVIGQDSRGCLTVSSPVTGEKKLVTNDIVEILSDKEFKWLGRIDNVINSGGIKLQIEDIELGVEKAFFEIGISNRFFIDSKADPIFGKKVVLVIESSGELAALKNLDWKKYLSQYQHPKEILYCPQFKETPTGKIDRQLTMANI